MSQANIEIVRGIYADPRGLTSAASPCIAPDAEFDFTDDEHVLVFVRVSATGHESGAQVEIRVAHEFTIRDDLVVRFKVYADREQALAAAGLAADPRM